MWKKVSDFGLLEITIDEEYWWTWRKLIRLLLSHLKVLDMHVKIMGLFLSLIIIFGSLQNLINVYGSNET